MNLSKLTINPMIITSALTLENAVNCTSM